MTEKKNSIREKIVMRWVKQKRKENKPKKWWTQNEHNVHSFFIQFLNINFSLLNMFYFSLSLSSFFCFIFLCRALRCNVAGVSSAFLEQRTKDGYNTFDDTSTIFPSAHNSIINQKWNEPYFDNTVPNNVTALVGKSAYLSCKVRNLGNKTVSN